MHVRAHKYMSVYMSVSKRKVYVWIGPGEDVDVEGKGYRQLVDTEVWQKAQIDVYIFIYVYLS